MPSIGIPWDSAAGRREFARRIQWRRQTEDEPEEFKSLKRGWYLGDRKFRKELLAQMKQQAREHHYGEDRAESEVEHAERVVKEGPPPSNGLLSGLSRHSEVKTDCRWAVGRT